MIPDIEKLRGRLVEVHGSPEADITQKMAAYIRQMQQEHNILTCYYDIRGELSKTMNEDDAFFEKVWVSPSLSGACSQEQLSYAANYTDLIVINDFTYLDGDVWQFLAWLRKVAVMHHVAIFLLNQKRFVKNHGTGEFEDLPYRYNVIQKYCSYVIDADTGKILLLESQEQKYDSFVEYLLHNKE